MIFSREAGFTRADYDETGLNRLNARFQVFMAPFRAELEGSKVLDLASHDGRWSYAALMLGAAHVTGIEARPELIERGLHIFEQEQIRGRATFISGDIFDVMTDGTLQGEKFDIVLCLGIFYHIMDHFRLLRLMREVGPALVILDTSLIDDEKPLIALETERNDHALNAIAVAGEEETVIGIVSKGALEMMAHSLGFSVTYLDWIPAQFENKAGLQDYFSGGPSERRRFSAVLRRA